MPMNPKRMTSRRLMKYVNEEPVVIPMDDGKSELVITPILPLEKVMKFVADVVESSFDDEDGEYLPEVTDFAYRISVIRYYTDISLPDKIERQFALVYASSLYEMILEHVSSKQLEAITHAITEKINHRLRTYENVFLARMQDLIARMEGYSNVAEDMFKDVSVDDLAKLSKTLGMLDDIDERSLVHAVFESQRDSDAVLQ